MQENLEESITFKRRFKRALIVLAIVEFIVTAFGVYYAMHK
jgi:hypothetical protein